MEPQGVYGVPQANLTGMPTHDPQLAAMRAQQNIAQKFGPLQARPASGLVLPGMNPGPPPQQRAANGQQLNGIPQHDGAGDCDGEITIEGFGSLTREEADQLLLKRIGKAERERAKATEELSQALQNLKVSSAKTKAKGKGKARRVGKLDAYDEALNPNSSYPYPSADLVFGEASSSSSLPAPRVPQLDGDSDEDDEDAINSDLDDPDEDEIDNDDDDEVPQIMLCMYDKVQRTKNKWKCVLKDGVLTINGQEYVFHKANGEYEW
jgi:transcription initiation factor TFIIA large subunit